MVSKYKLYPILLQEYTNKTTSPVVFQSSPLIEFHYSKGPLSNIYTSSFEIDPFSDSHLEVLKPDIDSLIPMRKDPIEPVAMFFRGLEYDFKLKKVILPMRHNSFPYLFIPEDTWWEYEDFKRFPDYEIWYSLKFKEWHKHVVMKDYDIVCFDPMWSIDPKEPYYDLYIYYYLTTIKYSKPWKIPLPTQVYYESNRKSLYFIVFFGIFFYYTSSHVRGRSRKIYMFLNEDWWINEYESIKIGTSNHSPFSADIDLPVFSQLTNISASFLINFRYGPNAFKQVMQNFEDLGELTEEQYYERIKK